MSKSTRAPASLQLLGATALGLAALTSSTLAQAQKKPTVVDVGEIQIKAYVPKPVAVVDIERLDPKLSLADLHKPFVDEIEKAILKSPF